MRSALVRRLSTAAIGAALFAVSLAAATQPTVKFTDTKLKNGLRVIVNEDHVAPVFAVAVVYNVGSRDERPGRTGFAHLFEHMMFKGSENVGPGEHFYSVFSNGGSMNGTTNKERTLYYEELPANQLDMALFLEADRMRSLSIEQGNLDNQRQAVQEERRLGVDNQPYGRTFEALDQLAFDNPAYKHSVIGSMDDLSAASVDDVAAFFKTYYAPNNAILVDFRRRQHRRRDRARRGSTSKRSRRSPSRRRSTHPSLRRQRSAGSRSKIRWPAAPRIDIAYHIPSSLSPDDDAIDLLSEVLATGRSSRFYEVLVRQKQLALAVGAFAENSRGPRLFHIVATVPPGKATDEVEAGIYAEIERLKAGPVADWEIEKSRNGARRQFVGTLNSSLSRASILAELTRLYGDPAKINTLYDRVAKLNANDVVRVAKQYLTTENRVVVVTMPKAAPAAKGGRAMMTTHRLLLGAAVLAFSAGITSVAAQQLPTQSDTQSTKGVVKKGKVPISNEILKIKLPRAAEADLSQRRPSDACSKIIGAAGSVLSSSSRARAATTIRPKQPGLAGVTAALMREGTASKTSSEISQQLEVMAASLTIGAGTSSPEATICGSSLTDQATKLLDLAVDVLLHPAFPEEELARYKQRAARAAHAAARQPRISGGRDVLARGLRNAPRSAHGPHGRRARIGSRATSSWSSIAATTFPTARCWPMSGDVSMLQARTLLEGKLAGWKKSVDGGNDRGHRSSADLGTEDLLHRAAERRPDELDRRHARRSSARIPTTTRWSS